MVPWFVVAVCAGIALLAACRVLEVRRYSGSHLVGHLAIGGRGLYFSRTPDGTWWKLRMRLRGCTSWIADTGDPPPDVGVREPRRPVGPGPSAGAVELDPPYR